MKTITVCTQCIKPGNGTVAPYHKIEILADLGEGKCPVCNWHTKANAEPTTLKQVNVEADRDVVDKLILEGLTDLRIKDPNSFWLVVQIEKHISNKYKFAIDNLGHAGFVQGAKRLEKNGLLDSSRIQTKWYNSDTMKKNPGVKTYRLKLML